jgi:hypothetical protein
MGMDSEIIIVSGLPRSGTSLMMQMLDQGGIEVVTDHARSADTDNPRGYYELEKVKRIKQDASWVPELKGKAVKMVSQLLYDLPPGHTYRIIFMKRDLDETLYSQEKMLQRLGRPAAPREEMKRAYTLHLERLHDWLSEQRHIRVFQINYNELIERPQEQAERLAAFLDGRPDVAAMVRSVDPSLYRNRKSGSDRPGG